MKKITLLLLLIGVVLLIIFIRPKRLFQRKTLSPTIQSPAAADKTSAPTDGDKTKPIITATGQSSLLHTDGKYIKDSQGNVVILRGVDFETYAFLKSILNGKYADHSQEDYQKIAGLGFNFVRLGISWQYIEPTEGNYDESYFTNYVDRDIEWARENGLYISLHFAQWGWSPHFENLRAGAFGLPSWLFNGYSKTEEGRTQSQKDFLLGKGPNGTPVTPSNPSMQDRMIKVWKYIAERYKDNSTIIAYDLFNEPPSGGLGIDIATDSYLNPFLERLIDNIKTVDNNHIFIYEPTGGQWKFAPRLLNKPNIIFSAHVYPGYHDTTKLGYSGNIAVLENQINGYLDMPSSNPSRNWNIPINMGEFGVTSSLYLNYGKGIQWINDMADTLDKYNTSWSYWHYVVDISGSSVGTIVNPDRTEVKAIAEALDKPYPRVNSVPPKEYSFDRNTKHFKVVFEGNGNLKTEIYIPYRYYPNGFLVNSNSTQWSKDWNESSRILTIQAALKGPIEITIDSK